MDFVDPSSAHATLAFGKKKLKAQMAKRMMAEMVRCENEWRRRIIEETARLRTRGLALPFSTSPEINYLRRGIGSERTVSR